VTGTGLQTDSLSYILNQNLSFTKSSIGTVSAEKSRSEPGKWKPVRTRTPKRTRETAFGMGRRRLPPTPEV